MALFALNEVPNPKNTGTMYISCGRRFKTFLRVTLDQAGIDATLTEINRHIDRIRATGFTDTRFDNVSPWAQKQIEDHLASFYIPSRDSKTPVVTQSW